MTTTITARRLAAGRSPARSGAPRRSARRPGPRSSRAASRPSASGFSVLGERRLALLPEATVRLGAPRNLSVARARARISELVPAALVGDNALYRPDAREACPAGQCFPYRAEAWGAPVCAARGAVGLIDTKVDESHPALAGRTVEVASTRGEKRKPSSDDHGTEVAILLAGPRAEPDDMRLVAVDAFHRLGNADRADVFDLVAAIDLLVERKVSVINLSLSGPANAVLDRAGAVAAERGVILVAAVGNDGPKAKPRYPAAYSWAVGVTALDAKGEIYRKAGRGAHVAFAAPGVRLEMPDDELKPGKQRSGTSYAAPLVAAALSAMRIDGDASPRKVVEALAQAVDDVGDPGRDPVFGWGALAPEKGCPAIRKADAG